MPLGGAVVDTSVVEGFSVVEDCVSDSIHSTKCSMLAYNLGAKWILQVAETFREVAWFENIQTDKNCVASKQSLTSATSQKTAMVNFRQARPLQQGPHAAAVASAIDSAKWPWRPCCILHCILRALKTSRSCSRRQTYVFQSKIAQGIHKWVQNNPLSSLPSNVFFKKLFSAPKIIKKIGRFVDFWIFV